MTSPKLAILQRQMERRQTPERIEAPAEDDLTAAIQRLVDQKVAAALEEQKPSPRVQRLLDRQFNKPAYTSFEQIPPTQKPVAKPVEATTTWHRDGAGRLLWCETIDCYGKRWVTKVERDAAGAILRAKTMPPDESPVLPPLDIDPKAKARKYREDV